MNNKLEEVLGQSCSVEQNRTTAELPFQTAGMSSDGQENDLATELECKTNHLHQHVILNCRDAPH